MHDLILNALFSIHALHTPDDRSRYLKTLKPAARALFGAYRPGYGKTVITSYQPDVTQAVYMLRYFPQYAKVVHDTLHELRNHVPFFSGEDSIWATIIGCGPAPELCGIMQFLKTRSSKSQKILVYLYDIASEDWAYARGITLNTLAPSFWYRGLFHAISCS